MDLKIGDRMDAVEELLECFLNGKPSQGSQMSHTSGESHFFIPYTVALLMEEKVLATTNGGLCTEKLSSVLLTFRNRDIAMSYGMSATEISFTRSDRVEYSMNLFLGTKSCDQLGPNDQSLPNEILLFNQRMLSDKENNDHLWSSIALEGRRFCEFVDVIARFVQNYPPWNKRINTWVEVKQAMQKISAIRKIVLHFPTTCNQNTSGEIRKIWDPPAVFHLFQRVYTDADRSQAKEKARMAFLSSSAVHDQHKDRERLNAFLRSELPPEVKRATVVTKCWDITVTISDLECLKRDRWLVDSVVHSYLTLLVKNTTDEVFCFSPHFMNLLLGTTDPADDMEDGRLYHFSRAEEFSSTVEGGDIFQLQKLFIPVNVANEHWILFLVDFSRRRIELKDSMQRLNGANYVAYFHAIFYYLQEEYWIKEKKMLPDRTYWTCGCSDNDVPKQINGKPSFQVWYFQVFVFF